MLKQRQDAAEHLAKRLFAAEGALDEAIRKMGDLIGYMPAARASANLSAVVGQDAIADIVRNGRSKRTSGGDPSPAG